MGMFSEIHAESTASDYEEILIAAIEEYKQDIGSEAEAIINFCEHYILPKYNDAIEGAWRSEKSENQKIINRFFDNS